MTAEASSCHVIVFNMLFNSQKCSSPLSLSLTALPTLFPQCSSSMPITMRLHQFSSSSPVSLTCTKSLCGGIEPAASTFFTQINDIRHARGLNYYFTHYLEFDQSGLSSMNSEHGAPFTSCFQLSQSNKCRPVLQSVLQISSKVAERVKSKMQKEKEG